MTDNKVKTILECEEPTTYKNVQSFIGFTNFNLRFIEGFSWVCKLLTNSPHNGGKEFKWTNACTEAFKQLTERFTTAAILRHFNPSLQPIIETDASNFGIGAVLFQNLMDGWLLPIAYLSKKIQLAKMNNKIKEKEKLAIGKAFQNWKRYLEEAKFEIPIYTDHKNLKYFTTTKVLNRQQAGWVQELVA